MLAAGAAAGDFRFALALSGDAAVVDVDWSNNDAGRNCGSDYIFKVFGGIWTQVAKLLAAHAAAGDYFGFALASAVDGADFVFDVLCCGRKSSFLTTVL